MIGWTNPCISCLAYARPQVHDAIRNHVRNDAKEGMVV
jgi:hypothetical protein